MKNTDIRAELEKRNIKVWELADLLSISESTIIRWLRHELPEDKKNQIIKTIREHSKTEV
mgnify:CR=1 FL=1